MLKRFCLGIHLCLPDLMQYLKPETDLSGQEAAMRDEKKKQV